MKEIHTIQEVLELAKIAKEKGLLFKFADEDLGYCVYTAKTAMIYKTMNPSQMYAEIERKCKDIGFVVNEVNFNQLKDLVEEL